MSVNVNALNRWLIAELMVRYAIAIDSADARAFGDVFTENGILVMRDNIIEGRTAIIEVAQKKFFDSGLVLKRIHVSPQFIITGGDDQRCHVRSYSLIVERQSDEYRPIRSMGYYWDVCVNTPSGWLFEQRRWEEWNHSEPTRYRLTTSAPA
jgi:hypothetical protein